MGHERLRATTSATSPAGPVRPTASLQPSPSPSYPSWPRNPFLQATQQALSPTISVACSPPSRSGRPCRSRSSAASSPCSRLVRQAHRPRCPRRRRLYPCRGRYSRRIMSPGRSSARPSCRGTRAGSRKAARSSSEGRRSSGSELLRGSPGTSSTTPGRSSRCVLLADGFWAAWILSMIFSPLASSARVAGRDDGRHRQGAARAHPVARSLPVAPRLQGIPQVGLHEHQQRECCWGISRAAVRVGRLLTSAGPLPAEKVIAHGIPDE